MSYVRVRGGTLELGWRHSGALTEAARQAIEDFAPPDELFEKRFSPARRSHLDPFEIASHATLTVEELLGDVYELDIDTLDDVCDACDAVLAQRSLRLPTEDELEAAFAGTLFPWGDLIPEGIPFGDGTTFRGQREPNPSGLVLLGDPYKTELTRTALKLGDGGEAICGGYPWPMAWLPACPAFRISAREAEETLFEYLETAHLRPVRLGSACAANVPSRGSKSAAQSP